MKNKRSLHLQSSRAIVAVMRRHRLRLRTPEFLCIRPASCTGTMLCGESSQKRYCLNTYPLILPGTTMRSLQPALENFVQSLSMAFLPSSLEPLVIATSNAASRCVSCCQVRGISIPLEPLPFDVYALSRHFGQTIRRGKSTYGFASESLMTIFKQPLHFQHRSNESGKYPDIWHSHHSALDHPLYKSGQILRCARMCITYPRNHALMR
jgi:hypothetical protein